MLSLFIYFNKEIVLNQNLNGLYNFPQRDIYTIRDLKQAQFTVAICQDIHQSVSVAGYLTPA